MTVKVTSPGGQPSQVTRAGSQAKTLERADKHLFIVHYPKWCTCECLMFVRACTLRGPSQRFFWITKKRLRERFCWKCCLSWQGQLRKASESRSQNSYPVFFQCSSELQRGSLAQFCWNSRTKEHFWRWHVGTVEPQPFLRPPFLATFVQCSANSDSFKGAYKVLCSRPSQDKCLPEQSLPHSLCWVHAASSNLPFLLQE